MRSYLLRSIALSIVLAIMLLPGCAASGGWAMPFLVAFAALGLAACAESHGGRSDAGRDGGVVGSGWEAGVWENCCRDGVVTTCLCPAGAACNYGLFDYCPDGTCTYGYECAGEPDAGQPPDAGAGFDAGPEGNWQACCVGGLIDSCFCPIDVECNYGWFENCGDGTCVDPGGTCPTLPPG